MSENNRRNILFAVAGAGLLIGAALLFHWANQSDDDTTDGSPKVDLKAELTALGLIKPKKQGSILDPQYFLQLLQFIGVQSKSQISKEGLEKRRREAKGDKHMDKYKALVMQEITMMENCSQAIGQEVLTLTGITEFEFTQTYQKFGSNEQMAQYVMAAQQGKLKETTPSEKPTLTSEQMLKCIEVNKDQMMKMMKKMQDPRAGTGDEQEQLMTMMVEQFLVQDETFELTGVENDEFEANLPHFMNKDPQVTLKMREIALLLSKMHGGAMGVGM